ncbi:MAG: hypothetical protein AUI33_14440 [Ignavibacteria bacterium 13_1_40CM_2_61_4]|nr:MAG: hypothetical protein AUI33_14440 [Ignavibacteria bacterium 13_1_40CM_2_61_4]
MFGANPALAARKRKVGNLLLWFRPRFDKRFSFVEFRVYDRSQLIQQLTISRALLNGDILQLIEKFGNRTFASKILYSNKLKVRKRICTLDLG